MPRVDQRGFSGKQVQGQADHKSLPRQVLAGKPVQAEGLSFPIVLVHLGEHTFEIGC